MTNLDQSISNGLILDESFSNYTGSDVTSLRNSISQLKSDLAFQKINLNAAIAAKASNSVNNILGTMSAMQSKLTSLENELSKIPKSIIDAVDKIDSSNNQLAIEEQKKLEAAELLALENKNKEIQAAIDKSKGVSLILDDKLKGNSNTNPSEISTESVSKETESKGFFTAKNIIIGASSILVLVGGFFLVKRLLKK